MSIVDNSRDVVSSGWSQRLGFNAGDERESLTAERLRDVRRSGVTANGESAHTLGKLSELGGLTIERDLRFPVRVTGQFYQATSTGVISGEHIDALAAQIDRVYAAGDYVGSLVVPERPREQRPTAWFGATTVPADLNWTDFPGLVARGQHGRYATGYLMDYWGL